MLGSFCNAVVGARRYGNASASLDVDIEHDHYPQSATRGAQTHAKGIDAAARIMEVTISEVP